MTGSGNRGLLVICWFCDSDLLLAEIQPESGREGASVPKDVLWGFLARLPDATAPADPFPFLWLGLTAACRISRS